MSELLACVVDRVVRVFLCACELHSRRIAISTKTDDLTTIEHVKDELWAKSGYQDWYSMGGK